MGHWDGTRVVGYEAGVCGAKVVGHRPLLSDTGGGGSSWPPVILDDPPTHPHQKIFPQEKNEIYQRAPNLEVDFRYTNFFLASDPPPPGIVSTSH